MGVTKLITKVRLYTYYKVSKQSDYKKREIRNCCISSNFGLMVAEAGFKYTLPPYVTC